MTAIGRAAPPAARSTWGALAVAGGTVAAGVAATVAAMLVDSHIEAVRYASCQSQNIFATKAPAMPWYGYALGLVGVIAAVVGLVLAIRARRQAILARKAGRITVAVLLGLVASVGLLFGLLIANGVFTDAKPDYASSCPTG
ncbi:MAG TPA: hypothetical protein VGL93_06190 [Streptosporangiaceae bacterium]|jgi:hypothetical protein